MTLLIVDTLETEVLDWLQERHEVLYAPELASDPSAFRSALYDASATIVPSSVTLDLQTLCHAPALRAIGRVGAGAENIDLDLCARAGIEVVRSFTATARAEAEFMIGALLTLMRRLPPTAVPIGWVGRELGTATVGLIGMAPAARTLAHVLGGLGTRVVGYDPALHSSDALWERWKISPLGLTELLMQADTVCVQLTCFSRYRGLFGERLLASCKRGQLFVCTGHSELFDEAALAQALRSGAVGSVWFDSLEPGTLDEGRPLCGLSEVLVTPRLASTTQESRLRSSWAVAKRIDELLTAEALNSTESAALLDPADEPLLR